MQLVLRDTSSSSANRLYISSGLCPATTKTHIYTYTYIYAYIYDKRKQYTQTKTRSLVKQIIIYVAQAEQEACIFVVRSKIATGPYIGFVLAVRGGIVTGFAQIRSARRTSRM